MMRRLRRVINRQTAGRRIRHGQDGTRLDRRPDKAVVDQIERGDVGGRRQRAFDCRRIAAFPTEARVAGSIGVKLRRIGRKRGAGIDHYRQRCVIDDDALRGIERGGQCLGKHRGDRFAHMAHPFARERKARRLGHGPAVGGTDDPESAHRPNVGDGHIGAGEGGDDAGTRERWRHIDGLDDRVRMRRTHQHAVQFARQADVADVAGAPKQKPRVLHPPDGGAYALAERGCGHLLDFLAHEI